MPSGWNLFPPHHVTLDKAHGRVEERKIWASSELDGYIDFPYVAQVFRIERNITKLKNNGITSLTEEKASPEKILELNRGHWKIENRLHWVRDVTYDEDRSRIRNFSVLHTFPPASGIFLSIWKMC